MTVYAVFRALTPYTIPWWFSDRITPVPIPNTAEKTAHSNNTRTVRSRKDSLPPRVLFSTNLNVLCIPCTGRFFYLELFPVNGLKNRKTPTSGVFKAGAKGFEPLNAWTKTRCLTAWRRPIASSGRVTLKVYIF
jgi:hypothetical protein